MPHEKTVFKYRCKEILCGNYVRSDKWNEHCKKKTLSKTSSVRYQFTEITVNIDADLRIFNIFGPPSFMGLNRGEDLLC